MYFKIFLIFILVYINVSTSTNCQVLPIDTIQYQGDPDDIINIVVLPDGYVEEELGKFRFDAQKLINNLFNKSPFKEYKEYFNVFLINAPSSESGANHPGNATDVTEPVFPVKTVNNRFGSKFDFAGIHRLLVPTNSFEIVNVLANNVPNYDQVLILVNSEFYGGSGGQYATTSLHTDASEIAIHEIGHSFANLADEYYAGDQYAREGPNMTSNNNPITVKWKNWHGEDNIGIYQHCCGDNSNLWYRPHNNCEMRFLNNSFCAVCRQQIIESIHFLTDPIYDFGPKEAQLNEFMLPLTFRLHLLKPEPNTLEVKWYLNSEEIKISADTFRLAEDMLQNGLNLIESSVEDLSEFLRVDNHANKHLYITTWEIEKSITGIELKNFEQFDFIITPNPTSDFLKIQLNDQRNGNLSINIYDLQGRLLINEKMNETSCIINLSSLPPNNYVLSIALEKRKIHSQLIAKI